MDATYEALQYGSKAIPHLHPERLGAVARAWGLETAPAQRCRVLDLGCAEGSHLLALALEYPESHFVGVDASPTQIDSGKRAAAALGIENLELVCGDFGIDVGKAEFDWVTAHGIYSWIPADAQQRLLVAIQRALSPAGVGYVGYEVFPGAHFRGARARSAAATRSRALALAERAALS